MSKLTRNQAEFNKQVKRLMRIQREAEREGIKFERSIVPEKPKRITKQYIERLKAIKPRHIKQLGVRENIDIIEKPKKQRTYKDEITQTISKYQPKTVSELIRDLMRGLRRRTLQDESKRQKRERKKDKKDKPPLPPPPDKDEDGERPVPPQPDKDDGGEGPFPPPPNIFDIMLHNVINILNSGVNWRSCYYVRTYLEEYVNKEGYDKRFVEILKQNDMTLPHSNDERDTATFDFDFSLAEDARTVAFCSLEELIVSSGVKLIYFFTGLQNQEIRNELAIHAHADTHAGVGGYWGGR